MNDEPVKEGALMAGIDAFPPLIATHRASTPVLAMAHQMTFFHTTLDHHPSAASTISSSRRTAPHADTALQLATPAAHGQLTTPDKQAAFLAERLTHAREEIVDAATPHTTTPAPHWQPNEAGAHRLPGR
ncbi:hypothetical protein [Mycolicibacterium komossense]|uniref:Uncharacterized protein n=1 Tax=Mycolicibacterium komossense TaxID=1779 RepID=A0ABT3C770_9MYCO|nr:hypothetical protein [Mycolicibacterium komossense]MCV7225275.1 hypothetical protein [Mycolicibacterium komossense]